MRRAAIVLLCLGLPAVARGDPEVVGGTVRVDGGDAVRLVGADGTGRRLDGPLADSLARFAGRRAEVEGDSAVGGGALRVARIRSPEHAPLTGEVAVGPAGLRLHTERGPLRVEGPAAELVRSCAGERVVALAWVFPAEDGPGRAVVEGVEHVTLSGPTILHGSATWLSFPVGYVFRSHQAVWAIEEDDGWLRVRRGEDEGWLEADAVERVSPPSEEPEPTGDAPARDGEGGGRSGGILERIPSHD